MYEKLRTQEQRVRHADSQEVPLFKKGDLVWLHSKRIAKNKSKKLQPKFTGPYQVLDVNRENHTCLIEQNGRSSRVAEIRLKLYHHAYQPQGRAPVVAEPTRQPTRQGMGRREPKLITEDDNLLVLTDNSEISPSEKTTPKRAVEISKESAGNQTESSVITKPRKDISMERPSRSSDIEATASMEQNISESGVVPDYTDCRNNEPSSLINVERNFRPRDRPRRPPKWLEDYVV